ncbi:MAG TPA: RES domain-containing protein [Vicinamibacterales bacterium]|nr:RES domain-containing protein [Vicinamibacterales bacterium]
MTIGSGSEFAKLLEGVPTRRMRRRLVRCVAALDFLEGSPPKYLYTSGRPGRCNPRDVDCLYFSETGRVADLEYRRRFAGVGSATKPRLTFFAEVDLRHVVDLSSHAVLETLDMSADDLFAAWRIVSSPTRLQRLGLAVSMQSRVSAIRFASDACRRAGTSGWNVAIFPGAITSPSRVRILGRSGASLEELP